MSKDPEGWVAQPDFSGNCHQVADFSGVGKGGADEEGGCRFVRNEMPKVPQIMGTP